MPATIFLQLCGLLLSEMILLIQNPGPKQQESVGFLFCCCFSDQLSSDACLGKSFYNLRFIFSSTYGNNNIYFKEQLFRYYSFMFESLPEIEGKVE